MTNSAFDAFMEAHVAPAHRPVVERFIAQMRELAFEATLRMRGGAEKYHSVPVFRLRRDFAAISPSRRGVTLSFTRGAFFTDRHGLLGGAGKRSRMRRVARLDAYPEVALADYITQALALEQAQDRS